MATCEERYEIYEAKKFGKVTWEAFTDMNEKQMVEVIEHLSEEEREGFMAAIEKQEEERKMRWAAKTKAEKGLFELVMKNELTQEFLTIYMEETEADLNSQDAGPMLAQAALHNNVEVMRMLLGAKADVDLQIHGSNMTALHYAARQGHDDCVALLIDAQADLESTNDKNRTALFYSLAYLHYSSTALLLDAKADAWAEDNDGITPMFVALVTNNKHPENMERIVQQSPNERGVTALMVAASLGNYPAIPKLLELGEDPELQDTNGMTALMIAMIPREGDRDLEVLRKETIIHMLRGDRTNAELNEMRRVLYFPKVPPPLLLPH